MRAITKVFKYLAYYQEADTPELRKEARDASTNYYTNQPIQLRTVNNILSFRRGYVSARCHQVATEKLKVATPISR